MWRGTLYNAGSDDTDLEFTIEQYINSTITGIDADVCSWTYDDMMDGELAYNDFEVTFASPGGRPDYLNGVNVADLVSMNKHINMQSGFIYTNGYQYISADVDDDNDIDSDDSDMLQDLILNLRNDLTRDSWEWVSALDVTNSTFLVSTYTNPYGYTISSAYAGVFFKDNVPFATLDVSQTDYRAFRCMKVGDLVGAANDNEALCGEAYFGSPQTSVRTNTFAHPDLGDRVLLQIDFDQKQNIVGMELPIQIDGNYFEIESFSMGSKSTRWHFNKTMNSLVFVDYVFNENYDSEKENAVTVVLKVTRSGAILDSHISWSKDRESIFVDDNIERIDLRPSMELELIKGGDLNVSNHRDVFTIQALYSKYVEIELFSADGRSLDRQRMDMNGMKTFEYRPQIRLISGVYFIKVTNHKGETISKSIYL